MDVPGAGCSRYIFGVTGGACCDRLFLEEPATDGCQHDLLVPGMLVPISHCLLTLWEQAYAMNKRATALARLRLQPHPAKEEIWSIAPAADGYQHGSQGTHASQSTQIFSRKHFCDGSRLRCPPCWGLLQDNDYLIILASRACTSIGWIKAYLSFI